LKDSSNNMLAGNTANSNNAYGIYISLLLYSSNNTLYHNNLIDNTQNAYDTRTNTWDSGTEGNYYSDYTGTDSNGDGIGDNPYPIPGGSSVDNFPLMSPSFAPSPPNQPPTCAIELQTNGNPIANINVGEFFDIYVGDSTDDQGIKEVRFSSDDSQDGNPTGEWTDWYDWNTSSGDWDAANKIKAWAFATGGAKEVWAEVKDGDGQTDKDSANIYANPLPIANAGQDQSVSSGDLVSFDGSNSYDPDGTIVSYHWDFGDGTTAEGESVNHRFRGKMDYPKSYTVTLTVMDDDGNKGTDNVVIKVEPLKTVAEVIIQPILPIVPSPFARVTAWYNWVDNVNGDDIYIVSYMNVRTEGIIGYYNILLWDEEHIHPIWSDLRGVLDDTVNYYPPPFKNIFGGTAPYKVVYYEDEIYEGTEVTDLAAIQIIAYGMAGSDFSPDGPGLPPLFFEVDSAVFQQDYVGEPDLPIESPDLTFIHLCSPGELRVYDSQGRVTGLVNGEIKEEIPNSTYNDEMEMVMILSSSSSFTYEVKGTDEGSYGLGVATIKDREFINFTATDIPTSANALHQYKIDWNALSQGEAGVTVQVDSDGDGTFEDTFTADNELSREEFLSATKGIYIESSDVTGGIKDIFALGESVYAIGSGYAASTTYNLYVVNDTTWTDGMTIPTRVTGTETTVTTDVSGKIPAGTLIWTSAVIGEYDIVVDVNGNGAYDVDTDPIDDMDVNDAGFETVPEFTTITIPVAIVFGLIFLISRKKRKE